MLVQDGPSSFPSYLGAQVRGEVGGAPPPRIAVIGGGIAGLAAATTLNAQPGVRVTLFEREPRFGGHAHTVDVTLPDAAGRPVTCGVDTGFLVYNLRTYPNLIALFDKLRVETAPSDMSFSVQAPRGLGGRSGRLEWSGSNLGTVFAQRRNLVSPRFWRMLRDVLRFNRLATTLAEQGVDGARAEGLSEPLSESLADFLARHHFSRAFVEGYLLPMIACIWSCPTGQMLQFPVGTLIRFCHNHGLLQVEDRPPWRTVRGGSRHYVQAMLRQLHDVRPATPVRAIGRRGDGVLVVTDRGSERFDAIVLACHAPQALALLGEDASPLERTLLGAQRTRPNVALLHTDAALMPRSRRAWAAWNYERAESAATGNETDPGTGPGAVCLHYWLNRLQPLPFAQPVLVSLNPIRAPRVETILGRYDYSHPVFDLAAIAAQRRLPEIQGQARTWFCGAWCGYGFHEDGLKSGLAAARDILQQWAAVPPSGPTPTSASTAASPA